MERKAGVQTVTSSAAREGSSEWVLLPQGSLGRPEPHQPLCQAEQRPSRDPSSADLQRQGDDEGERK